jgi:hypothetical protein
MQLDTYLLNLQLQWQARIREMSPVIGPMKFVFKMRYQGNMLRVWFTPEELANAGLSKPIAEIPIVKGIWWSNDADVLTDPSMRGLAEGNRTKFKNKVIESESR